jgi:hypothetical protein
MAAARHQQEMQQQAQRHQMEIEQAQRNHGMSVAKAQQLHGQKIGHAQQNQDLQAKAKLLQMAMNVSGQNKPKGK